MTNVTNQPSETPDPFHVLKEGLISKKGLRGEKEITLKDLAKVRGEGLGMVATSYNQLKLLVTKGIVIKDKDIAKIMNTLDDEKLKSISNAFKKIQEKDVNLSKPPLSRHLNKLLSGQKITESEEKEIKQNFKDIERSKKNVKQIKQTTKEAQVFANMLKAHMPREKGAPISPKITYDTATTAIEKSEDASTRLNAVLFLEKNMEGILKSTLYEIRSIPNWKEGWDGPAKDFVNFIGDREIKDEKQLAQAVKDFQIHIREGGISTESLKNYSPKNKTLTTYQSKTLDSSNFIKSLNETPLETLNILKEIIAAEHLGRIKETLLDYLKLNKETLRSLVNDKTAQPLLEEIYSQSIVMALSEYHFVKEVEEYKQLVHSGDLSEASKKMDFIKNTYISTKGAEYANITGAMQTKIMNSSVIDSNIFNEAQDDVLDKFLINEVFKTDRPGRFEKVQEVINNYRKEKPPISEEESVHEKPDISPEKLILPEGDIDIFKSDFRPKKQPKEKTSSGDEHIDEF